MRNFGTKEFWSAGARGNDHGGSTHHSWNASELPLNAARKFVLDGSAKNRSNNPKSFLLGLVVRDVAMELSHFQQGGIEHFDSEVEVRRGHIKWAPSEPEVQMHHKQSVVSKGARTRHHTWFAHLYSNPRDVAAPSSLESLEEALEIFQQNSLLFSFDSSVPSVLPAGKKKTGNASPAASSVQTTSPAERSQDELRKHPPGFEAIDQIKQTNFAELDKSFDTQDFVASDRLVRIWVEGLNALRVETDEPLIEIPKDTTDRSVHRELEREVDTIVSNYARFKAYDYGGQSFKLTFDHQFYAPFEALVSEYLILPPRSSVLFLDELRRLLVSQAAEGPRFRRRWGELSVDKNGDLLLVLSKMKPRKASEIFN